jgi:homoserine dehydrogenase
MPHHSVEILGFGPIGRKLAETITTDPALKNMGFSVQSISDSTAKIFPKRQSDVYELIKWKEAGQKFSELKNPSKPKTDAEITIDVTNSDYSKPEEARKRAIDALSSGKHFVSANKVALSNYFNEITTHAKKKNLQIGYGGAICGGRYAITIARSIGSSEVTSAAAVLNASTTLILSSLEENSSVTFDEACKNASKEGVLESDWAIDLDGIDAAAKTAILSNVLFPKSKTTLKNMKISGIRDDRAKEIISKRTAREKVRLVSRLTPKGASVKAEVLAGDSPLAVQGRFNAVLLETKSLGDISTRNLGGGVALTTSVLVSDLKQILVG